VGDIFLDGGERRSLFGWRKGLSGMVRGRFWRFGKMARLVSIGLSLVLEMEDEELHIEMPMEKAEMRTGVKDVKGWWERLARWEF
jgi:hypothetical protein